MNGPAVWSHEALDDLFSSTNVAVDRGVRARHAAGADWGRIVHGVAAAVVRPMDPDQVSAVVCFAYERDLPLTPRASGASQSGQAVADDSVVLDLSAMAWVDAAPEAATIWCGPGATWRSVLARTLPHGFAPCVVPMHLDLTVGGTLSVGGIGSTSLRFGAAASNVSALDVVTGTGARVMCDASERSDLFDAVRAGLGRCGVIVAARLALRRVGPTTRVATLAYRDADDVIGDLRRIAMGSLAHAQALGHPGTPPVFIVEIADDSPDGTLADLEKTVADLRHERIVEIAEVATSAFAARFDPRFDAMISSGLAGAAHPWVDAFVPFDAAAALMPAVVATAAGDEHDRVQLIPVDAAAFPPFLAAPAGGLAVAVVVVPRGIQPPEVDAALDAMRRVNDMLLEAGGTRYLGGWFPDPTAEMWQRQFDGGYERWLNAKREHDPRGIFVSALFPREGR